MTEDEKFMEQALLQAEAALNSEEFPVGCVVVADGRVLVSGLRQGTAGKEKGFSEIDHAEIRALKALENVDVSFNPRDCALYCTMEPCLMCFAAIMLSGIRRIVYAFEDPMGGGTSMDRSGLAPLYRDCDIQIVPGVMRQKSLDFFYKFFNKEANFYWKDSYLEKYIREQYRD